MEASTSLSRSAKGGRAALLAWRAASRGEENFSFTPGAQGKEMREAPGRGSDGEDALRRRRFCRTAWGCANTAISRRREWNARGGDEAAASIPCETGGTNAQGPSRRRIADTRAAQSGGGHRPSSFWVAAGRRLGAAPEPRKTRDAGARRRVRATRSQRDAMDAREPTATVITCHALHRLRPQREKAACS